MVLYIDILIISAFIWFQMSKHRANVGSNEAQCIKKTKTKIRFKANFKDSIKTCYSEVNVVLAEAKGVRSKKVWVRLWISDPQKYFPISHTGYDPPAPMGAPLHYYADRPSALETFSACVLFKALLNWTNQ